MNQKTMMSIGTIGLVGILLISINNIGVALGSNNADRKQGDVYTTDDPQMAATGKLYREECGSCHMAYPPQLLPPQSWDKIMGQLDDHFDENAELDSETTEAIRGYLSGLSARKSYSYQKMRRNLGDETPLRITELPYFVHEHDEIPSRFIRNNDKLSSLSQCDACHKNAAKGWFDEDNVSIPGVGRWDD